MTESEEKELVFRAACEAAQHLMRVHFSISRLGLTELEDVLKQLNSEVTKMHADRKEPKHE